MKESGFKFELSFLDKDKHQRSEKSVDWVIETRHIGHKVEDHLKAQHPNRVVFAPGGIGAVMSKLADIHSRQ